MSRPSSIPGDGTSDPFTMQDPRPTPSSRENSHVHHIHEFGEVDRIVHVAPSETSITDDHDPVVPASADQSPSAKIKREKRVWNRLFHDRHLMQYFYQGTLYRTVGKRKVGTEELFFDLVIVAAVAALGHELRISEITWQSTEKFILLFSAVYNSWRQSVLLWNLWGIQEDLLEKAGIYVTFFALSGIALGGHNAFDDLARPFVAVSAFVASAIPALAGVAWSFSESLMKNPANRVNQLILSDIFTFVSIVPYLIAACVRDENLTRNLYWVAFGLQLAALLIPHQLYRHLHRRIDDYTRIALNIELVVEKYEVLTMIVLGETMIGLLFEGGSKF
ncbi:unnamed protein product [Chondrus crispus]|uniref:Uncharacterized protein n=1 Tax=Chondrus crispus TaxID=2769 RepID=R7QBI7_CHOCR|nr:unnamed protein product [Chondrus crispus]CDF34786.1 unnamed protein product [Chondrus crispus]|eukprot:XP_005714605.1 unnamed protein product [Chondrus crispus]